MHARVRHWSNRALVRKHLCLVTVSEYFISDNRDGWREHEDNKANRHVDAGERSGNGERNDTGGTDQQPDVKGIKPADETGVEHIDRSEKDTGRNDDTQHRCECDEMGPVLNEQAGTSRRSRQQDQIVGTLREVPRLLKAHRKIRMIDERCGGLHPRCRARHTISFRPESAAPR